MTGDALRHTAQNLVRQGAGQLADLVRADANAAVFADEHGGVPRRDAVHVRDVDADLVHAHNSDDGAAPPANRQESTRGSAVGERTGQPLPVAGGGGADAPARLGTPRAHIADTLAAG